MTDWLVNLVAVRSSWYFYVFNLQFVVRIYCICTKEVEEISMVNESELVRSRVR